MMTLPVMETVLPRTSSASALSRGDEVALEPRRPPKPLVAPVRSWCPGQS